MHTQKNILQSQTNVEENNNSESSNEPRKLIERIPLKDTPFTIIVLEDEQWFIALGKYKICEPQEANWDHLTLQQQARIYLDNHMWEILGTVVSILTNSMTETLFKTYEETHKH